MKKQFADLYSLLKLYRSDPKAAQLIREVRKMSLSYLDITALVELYDQAKRLEREKKTGIFIEAGVALGGSALAIAAGKHSQRPLYLYDTFEMIPPPSDRDGNDAHERYKTISSGNATGIKGNEYYGYQKDLQKQVIASFRRFNLPPEKNEIRFIKGYYQDTLVVATPVALAHIDSDWYDSVMVCLEAIVPRLISGGVIVVDDYNDWSGCRRAIDDYFQHRMDEFEFRIKSRLHITKI